MAVATCVQNDLEEQQRDWSLLPVVHVGLAHGKRTIGYALEVSVYVVQGVERTEVVQEKEDEPKEVDSRIVPRTAP